MRPAWREADRAAELLSAARGWRAAGLIDEASYGAIAGAPVTAGPRLGPVWRTLVFVFVVAGVSTSTMIGFFTFELHEPAGVGLLLLLFGAILAVITDLLVDRHLLQPTGAEAATALLAAGYLCFGLHALLDARHVHGNVALGLISLWCAAVFGLAAWRWGFRPFAGAAAGFVLLFASQLPGSRITWALAAALLGSGAGAVLSTRDLAPSHRDGVALVRIVGLAALYAAVNYLCVAHGWIEELGRAVGAPRHRADTISLAVAAVGSALFPAAVLARGLRARDRALIDLGIVSAALSLATVLFSVRVVPRWAELAAAGAGLAGGSLLLERWLLSGRDAERSGFTAVSLSEGGWSKRRLPAATASGAERRAP